MGRFDDRATTRIGAGSILRWQADRLRGAGDPALPPDPRFNARRVENDGSVLAQEGGHLTWIGHASFALRLGGQVLAFDPIWRTRFGPRQRLLAPGLPLETLADQVDVVLVSHDHFDHLDVPTLRRLARPRQPLFVVPLGLAGLMKNLGATRVVELDWWQTHREGNLELTLVPARHWSMRRPWSRNSTLWGGFVVRGPEGSAYHSGDTGYFDTFAEIGKRAGPIDWAMLPIGAYSPRWFMNPQHMCPEEAGQAFELLGAKRFVAMHWGTFKLTDEPPAEPAQRLQLWAESRGYSSEQIWVMDVGETRDLVQQGTA